MKKYKIDWHCKNFAKNEMGGFYIIEAKSKKEAKEIAFESVLQTIRNLAEYKGFKPTIKRLRIQVKRRYAE